MAGYPGQPPYGVNYGDEQTNNQYQPPYSNPYMQPNASAQSHMGANYNAYGYNNAPVAPFPTPSVAPGVPPLPLFQGWNQDPIPLPPFTTPQNSTPYQTYNQSTQNQAGQQYYSAASQPGYAPTRTAHQSHDRDFSEGEFEGSAPSHTPVNYTASQWGGNGRNGYVDTAQRAVYNKPQEYNSQPPTHSGNYKPHSRDNSQKRGRQSGSHSPYVSSGGGDREESKGASQKKSYNRAQPSVDRPKSQVGLPRTIPTPHRANGFHTSGQDAKAEQELQPAQSDISSASGIPANANGKSHLEMKKKAQNAILTLWPRDHRYQALLDAGMKEDIVSSLYDDLKLSKTSNAANSESDRPTPNATNIPSSTEPSASKGTPMPNGASAPVIAVSAPRSTAMDEKQKTLQSKMEALRKSREQRAQKAALGTSSKTAATPTAVAGVKRAEPTAIIVEAPKSPQQSTYALASQIPKEAVTANATPSESQAPPPPAPVNNAPQVSAIPGLFLVSNPPPPAPTASLAPPAGVVSQRKRPVATDFDDPTPPVAFKRPFGHNRHEKPLIIDVSDEESDDEDVAMELDSQAGSPDQPPPKMSDQRTRPAPLAQQHSNSSPDFHTRPQSTIQPGAVEVLKKKENEIEALKRLIAEREAQKRSKARNTPNSSGQQTPRASEVQSTAINGAAGPTNGDLTRNAELSMQIQDKMEVADQKVAIDSQKLAEVQAAEAEKAEELSKKEAEEKRLRRQKIASDLPMVAAEVQQQKSRLEEMRAEMAKIEADMQKKLEGQKILAEEMERLGQETEDQLQAHKDKLEELNQAEAKDVGSSRLSSSSVDDSSIKHEGGERQLSNVIATTISTADDHSINAEPTLPPIEQPIQNTNGTLSNAMEEDNDHYKDSLSTDQALEAQLQNSIQAEADSHAHDEMEIEQVYAPDPRQLGPEMASSPPEEPEEGQISEDEYSPVLDRAMPDVPDHESDGYEPPDATVPDENDAMDSPPFSPAPPIPVPNLNDDELRVINPTQVADLSGRSGVEDTPAFEHGGVLHEVEVVAKTGGPQFFTPYESPLKIFHAYRFHPLFKQSVAGGLRSLTYSNKINANIELCPYETAGGICNDDTCHFQHFRSIKLPDDAIMAAIGSPEEFQGEQRENFTDSLREVLMGLRVRKIKDFATISSEIIAHRAKFLNDPSKTLAALEGVSL